MLDELLDYVCILERCLAILPKVRLHYHAFVKPWFKHKFPFWLIDPVEFTLTLPFVCCGSIFFKKFFESIEVIFPSIYLILDVRYAVFYQFIKV